VATKIRNLQVWIQARRRHHLTHAQVQMARELGMNPQKLGKLDNHKQEKWKAPLPQFIEYLYFKRFGRRRPERVASLEERAEEIEQKRQEKREHKRLDKTTPSTSSTVA
jgi:SOS-response transcriptional repressor LexA